MLNKIGFGWSTITFNIFFNEGGQCFVILNQTDPFRKFAHYIKIINKTIVSTTVHAVGGVIYPKCILSRFYIELGVKL